MSSERMSDRDFAIALAQAIRERMPSSGREEFQRGVPPPQIALTPAQLAHLPSLRWLLADGHRRSGRTFLLAWAFIDKALEHPSRDVQVFDHSGHGHQAARMLEIIQDVASARGVKGIQIRMPQRSIRFEPLALAADGEKPGAEK
jgi:hypothetical protein